MDLSRHLDKVIARVILMHPSDSFISHAASFLLALEPELKTQLVHLCLYVKGNDEEENNSESTRNQS